MLTKDLNSRTGTADNYLPNDGSNNFVNISNGGPNIEMDDIISNSTENLLKLRISQDKVLGTIGNV